MPKSTLTKDEQAKFCEQIRLVRGMNPTMTKSDVLVKALNDAGFNGRLDQQIQSCGRYYNKAMGITPVKRVNGAKVVLSAYDRLQDARTTILTAIKDLEFEREELHKKVLDYDDVIAKYKKLI